jgi:hypothetical protein
MSAVAGTAIAASSIAALQLANPGAASAAPAAACISSSNLRAWSTTSGGTKTSPTYTTTVNCVDINFGWAATDNTIPVGKVRVCFVGAGYCQSTWKSYNGNTAADTVVIATNVSDGTTYRVEFAYSSASGEHNTFKIYA